MSVKVEVLKDLAAETPANEIKQRAARGKGGALVYNPDGTQKMLDYVDARFVQDRLDEVLGPENWQSRFESLPPIDGSEGIRGGIGINIDGEWVWKWDVGTPSNIEGVKGAHSDAFKRAAVQWGIGRDLYDRPTEAEEETLVVQPAPGTVRQQVGANGGAQAARYAGAGQNQQAAAPAVQQDTRTAEEVEQDAYALGLVWSCEQHPAAGVRYTPAGVSRSAPYRPYAARIRCGERNCRENGPIVGYPPNP